MRPRQEPVIASLFRELQPEYDTLDEKYPVSPQSRYRFELDYYQDESLRSSIQRLFGISSMPSDTTIRPVLDRLSPEDLCPLP
ncbi:MAG: hypothetical protein OXO49_00690 [Gammaproteobacteria bacterium]|nr:hypothetical protein [Gammaproteobacteria bacterium]MDE0251496.1 hypothetical protein [Gammaproteobacteria bacterium]MDE0401821.1 hypothetical protein [Gammaproteobacteria bacterium]